MASNDNTSGGMRGEGDAPAQLLHLVFGGELESVDGLRFADLVCVVAAAPHQAFWAQQRPGNARLKIRLPEMDSPVARLLHFPLSVTRI